ncbi:hypothetical protein ACMFMG_006537 [Clarireedia jacksonii]
MIHVTMHFLSIPQTVLLLLALSQSFLSVVESKELATCYFPDSTIAENFVACSSTQDGSCCQSGDLCTQYGYCVSQSKGYHYRGACTDGSWGNPSCPDYCLGSSSGNGTYVDVIACNAASSDGTWCCAYNGNCCSSSSTYTPGFGTMFAAANAGSTSSASSSAPTMLSTTTTSSALASSTTASHTTSSASAITGSSHTATIVGAAVGIPLGLVALTGMLLFYRERKKRMSPEVRDYDMKKGNDGSVSSVGAPPEGFENNTQPLVRTTNHYELNGGQTHELGDH